MNDDNTSRDGNTAGNIIAWLLVAGFIWLVVTLATPPPVYRYPAGPRAPTSNAPSTLRPWKSSL